jgi:predicted phosphodiesterase
MCEVGDDRQNMRNFRNLSAVLNQVLSPKQQAHMLRGVVEELTANDKLLAKVGGNHDEEFDQRIFGEALQGYLLEKMKAPRFKNRGLVYLTVGEIEYTILLFHKSRFKSFLRRTHGAMREHQLSFPADIVMGGHDHEPGMEHLHHYTLAEQAGEVFGGETLFIKVGTYQDSEYGWRYFHSGGFAANYTTVLFPHEKKMQCFTNPRDAMRYADSFK